jgi:hypothetical protein
MDPPVRGHGEGFRRIGLAVVLATAVFPCWMVIAYCIGAALPSVHPATMGFVSWAGAGVMAGLVAAWIVPSYRWIIVPPLLVALEIGFNFAWAIVLTVENVDIKNQKGLLEGMCGGVVLGVLFAGCCRVAMRPAQRLAIIAFAAGAFLAVSMISAWRGRGDLVAMRQSVLPAVQMLLRKDVLAKTGPVQWIEVRRNMSDEGELYVFAYGEMRNPQVKIYLEAPNLQRWTGKADELQGLSLYNLEIQLPQPRRVSVAEERRAETVKQMLRSTGVRPELAARMVIRERYPGGPQVYAVAIYHGIKYEFDWHFSVGYGFERMDFPPSSTFITCSGTYSASAP